MRKRRALLGLIAAAPFAGLAVRAATPPGVPVPVTGTTFAWDCPVCGSGMRLSAEIDLVTPAAPPTPAPTPAPPPTYSSIDDEGFTYFGPWIRYPNDGTFAKYGTGDHASDILGASFGILFSGTEIHLVSATAPYHGIASVSLDGGPPFDVDYYSPVRVDQALVWSSGPIPLGAHRIMVNVSGRLNPASTGRTITADRIDVTNGTIIPALGS